LTDESSGWIFEQEMWKWRLVGSSNDAVHGSCFVVVDNGTGVQISDGRVHVGAPYRTSNSMKDPVKFSFVVPSYLSAHGGGASVEKQVQCRDPRLFSSVSSIEQSNRELQSD